MKLIYYYWGENSHNDIADTFLNLGHEVIKISYPLKSYDTDSTFETQIKQLIFDQKPDFIFSFNFFPILSNLCQSLNLLYCSWIYDCPHFSLFSKSVYNSCNQIFLFDKEQYLALKKRKVTCVHHLILAANTTKRQTQIPIEFPATSYLHDISFVGSFYEQNLFSQISYLPDYLHGYIDGILSAQETIWGSHLIPSLLDESFLENMRPYLPYENKENYDITYKDFLTFLLDQKLTFQERKKYLNLIAKQFPLDIYSGSDVFSLCPNAKAHGFISYDDVMPVIFHRSKINLNFSLRSISSGIPLRCMDILGCGGFLLSNYQPELAEYFIPNVDFVYFEREQDLLNKIAYYKTHDEERNAIAKHGFETVKQLYSYEHQVQQMLSLLFL